MAITEALGEGIFNFGLDLSMPKQGNISMEPTQSRTMVDLRGIKTERPVIREGKTFIQETIVVIKRIGPSTREIDSVQPGSPIEVSLLIIDPGETKISRQINEVFVL